MCRPSEEIFQALDDNQVTLATMKASRFVKPFLAEVDSWERKLSHILEVIEMILQIQKQWMYLEVGRRWGSGRVWRYSRQEVGQWACLEVQ